MKKALFALVALNAALAVGLGWKILPTHAAGGLGGATPVVNGDVNGDGKIDLSDR